MISGSVMTSHLHIVEQSNDIASKVDMLGVQDMQLTVSSDVLGQRGRGCSDVVGAAQEGVVGLNTGTEGSNSGGI